ncbi:MAG: response regulator [Pseudomonadota bacterium]
MRASLVGLGLIAVVPLIALFGWNAWQAYESAVALARDDLARTARLLAEDMAEDMRAAQRLLHALGAHPDVRAARNPQCGEILRAQLAHSRRYTTFFVADRDGRSLCDALRTARPENYADREYFARALLERAPVVGRPVVGRATGRPVLPVAVPLLDAAGEVERLIVTGLDLEQLGASRGFARTVNHPAFTIWDTFGTILYRYPENEKWVGQRFPDLALTQAMRSAGGAVTLDAAGLDGVARVYAADTLEEFPDTGIILSLGLARADLVARAEQVLARSLTALALVVATLVALGWVLSERLLRRPVALLDAAQRRLAAGDLAARVPAEGVGGELGRLLGGFNDTAAALETKHAELRALNADLERRVAERTAALEAARRETEDLYDNAPCGYHSLDAQGTVVRMNATELAWLGYARDDVVGRVKFADLLTPQGAETFRRRFPEFVRTGRIADVEFDLVRKDGSTLPVSLSATALRDAGGRFVMSRSTVFDIAERRRAAAEIARKNQELQRANEMKSQFLATMSHELRTPLNAIIGFAEVLKDGLAGELTDEQKAFTADIHASGRHLLSLINDILDLSKVEAGMMTLEVEPVELAPLLQGSLTMVKEKAMKHRLALDLAIEPGLPAFAADARKVKQIVFNLLSNAVKFTPEGGRVRLSARRVARAQVALPADRPGRMGDLPADATREFVEIAVADSGIGIAEADLERLFQSFVQIDSALGRQHHGTGLGLALVKRLAALHGGTAGVASAPGCGSSFFVWLPLAEAAAQPPAPAVAGAARRERTEPLALVVEDNDDVARMIERELRAEGFRCRRAATAEEALVRAAKERPDLVTLDVFLPHMDGWEFLERLKADPALAHIPVVIVSVAGNLEYGIALGATRVLQKPFSKAELQATLAGIVPLAPAGASGTVLIADDNPQAVELLAGYLADANCRLLRAYGGREAIEAAQRQRPDLILLDLMMPDVSGFDVVARLKADPATAAIPVVVVTAKDLTAEDRAALNGSVERIVAKAGIEAKDFVAEVRRALRGLGEGR